MQRYPHPYEQPQPAPAYLAQYYSPAMHTKPDAWHTTRTMVTGAHPSELPPPPGLDGVHSYSVAGSLSASLRASPNPAHDPPSRDSQTPAGSRGSVPPGFTPQDAIHKREFSTKAVKPAIPASHTSHSISLIKPPATLAPTPIAPNPAMAHLAPIPAVPMHTAAYSATLPAASPSIIYSTAPPMHYAHRVPPPLMPMPMQPSSNFVSYGHMMPSPHYGAYMPPVHHHMEPPALKSFKPAWPQPGPAAPPKPPPEQVDAMLASLIASGQFKFVPMDQLQALSGNSNPASRPASPERDHPAKPFSIDTIESEAKVFRSATEHVRPLELPSPASSRLFRHGAVPVVGESHLTQVWLSTLKAAPRVPIRLYIEPSSLPCRAEPKVVGMYRSSCDDCRRPIAMKSLTPSTATGCFTTAFLAPKFVGSFDFRVFDSEDENALPIGRSLPFIVSIQGVAMFTALQDAYIGIIQHAGDLGLLLPSTIDACTAHPDAATKDWAAELSDPVGVGAAYRTFVNNTTFEASNLPIAELKRLLHAVTHVRLLLLQATTIPGISSDDVEHVKRKPSHGGFAASYTHPRLPHLLWRLMRDTRYIALLVSSMLWRLSCRLLGLSHAAPVDVDPLTHLDKIHHFTGYICNNKTEWKLSDVLSDPTEKRLEGELADLQVLASKMSAPTKQIVQALQYLWTRSGVEGICATTHNIFSRLVLVNALHAEIRSIMEFVEETPAFHSMIHTVNADAVLQQWRQYANPLTNRFVEAPIDRQIDAVDDATPLNVACLAAPSTIDMQRNITESVHEYLTKRLFLDALTAYNVPSLPSSSYTRYLMTCYSWLKSAITNTTWTDSEHAPSYPGDAKLTAVLRAHSQFARHGGDNDAVSSIQRWLTTIVKVLNESVTLSLYGSSVTGLATRLSDVNFALQCSDAVKPTFLPQLYMALKLLGVQHAYLQSSGNALLRFIHADSGKSVTVTYLDPVWKAHADVVNALISANEARKDVAVCFTAFAESHRIAPMSIRHASASFPLQIMSLSCAHRDAGSANEGVVHGEGAALGGKEYVLEAADGQSVQFHVLHSKATTISSDRDVAAHWRDCLRHFALGMDYRRCYVSWEATEDEASTNFDKVSQHGWKDSFTKFDKHNKVLHHGWKDSFALAVEDPTQPDRNLCNGATADTTTALQMEMAVAYAATMAVSKSPESLPDALDVLAALEPHVGSSVDAKCFAFIVPLKAHDTKQTYVHDAADGTSTDSTDNQARET